MTPFHILQLLAILITEKQDYQEHYLIQESSVRDRVVRELQYNAGAGTYDYYCTLHPYMKGQLTIEE